MAIVLSMKNVVVNNPNLPILAGVNPNKSFGEVWINFYSATPIADSQWNEVHAYYNQAVSIPDVISSSGILTNVSISSTSLLKSLDTGATDSSLEYIYIGVEGEADYEPQSIYIDGLSKKRLYEIEFLAARVATDSVVRIGYYSANGVETSVDATNNTETAVLTNIAADNDGRIEFIIDKKSSAFAYLCWLKVKELN